jgi:hypothetical protein
MSVFENFTEKPCENAFILEMLAHQNALGTASKALQGEIDCCLRMEIR